MTKIKLLDELEKAIDQTLADAKVAYREHLTKSLKEIFVKYLKLQKK